MRNLLTKKTKIKFIYNNRIFIVDCKNRYYYFKNPLFISI